MFLAGCRMLLVGTNRRPLLDFRSRFPLLAVHSQIRSFEPLSTISSSKYGNVCANTLSMHSPM